MTVVCVLVPVWSAQTIKSKGKLSGAGLRYLSVAHEGNQSSSREEADVIRNLVAEILSSGTTWINREGVEAPVGLQEILVIAPCNAQVFELQERIPGARIGTVDKFQGREAPIVIYSMTPLGRSARHGVSLQCQSSERRDFAREMHLHRGRIASLVRGGVSNAPLKCSLLTRFAGI